MKKKVLIRIGSLRHGGAEKVLVTFLNNLPPDKYEVDLLLNLYSGKYIAEVPAWVNIFYLNYGDMITTNRLHEIPRKAWRKLFQGALKKWSQLLYRFILKNKKYDIELAAIHAMRDEILNSPLKDSRKIVWIHNDLRKTHFHKYTDAEIRKFFGFNRIMVISEQIQREFEDLAETAEEKSRIVRIYNPLDTEEIIRKSAEPLTTDYNLPQEETTQDHQPTFLSVGTIFPQKGFDRLINAHEKLLKEGFPHRLLIIGDGINYHKTLKEVKDRGLENTVLMPGFVENPYPFFKTADFYVLSSRFEGFPTVLYEALTLKKNIIATSVSGVNEMLEKGKLGLIVENSEEGIYSGMKKALTDPESFDTFVRELADYESPFTLQNSVNRLMEILDE